MNYADLEDMDDCIFSGVVEGDLESTLLVTGCEDEDIDVQIHSEVFGDWIFPTKNGEALAIVFDEDDYDYEYKDYIENDNFDEQFPIVPEDNPIRI